MVRTRRGRSASNLDEDTNEVSSDHGHSTPVKKKPVAKKTAATTSRKTRRALQMQQESTVRVVSTPKEAMAAKGAAATTTRKTRRSQVVEDQQDGGASLAEEKLSPKEKMTESNAMTRSRRRTRSSSDMSGEDVESTGNESKEEVFVPFKPAKLVKKSARKNKKGVQQQEEESKLETVEEVPGEKEASSSIRLSSSSSSSGSGSGPSSTLTPASAKTRKQQNRKPQHESDEDTSSSSSSEDEDEDKILSRIELPRKNVNLQVGAGKGKGALPSSNQWKFTSKEKTEKDATFELPTKLNVQTKTSVEIHPTYEIKQSATAKQESKIHAKKIGEIRDWHEMVTPKLTPELEADLKALQLRNYMDPKRFYKAADRKGKLPEKFQIGTVVASGIEPKSQRLTKKQQKPTLVDEILGDQGIRQYTKRVYSDIQRSKYRINRSKTKMKRRKFNHANKTKK